MRFYDDGTYSLRPGERHSRPTFPTWEDYGREDDIDIQIHGRYLCGDGSRTMARNPEDGLLNLRPRRKGHKGPVMETTIYEEIALCLHKVRFLETEVEKLGDKISAISSPELPPDISFRLQKVFEMESSIKVLSTRFDLMQQRIEQHLTKLERVTEVLNEVIRSHNALAAHIQETESKPKPSSAAPDWKQEVMLNYNRKHGAK